MVPVKALTVAQFGPAGKAEKLAGSFKTGTRCPNVRSKVARVSESCCTRTVRHGPIPPSPRSTQRGEVALASDMLRTAKQLGPDTRFSHVQLEEPAKADILGWTPERKVPAAGGRQRCSTARPVRPMSQPSISGRSR